MTMLHEGNFPAAPWEWHLPARQARVLPAQRGVRWLEVRSGEVWLTGGLPQRPRHEDIWLRPGERHALPAGSHWVLEGWPEAVVQLLVQPERPSATHSLLQAAAVAVAKVWGQVWLGGTGSGCCRPRVDPGSSGGRRARRHSDAVRLSGAAPSTLP